MTLGTFTPLKTAVQLLFPLLAAAHWLVGILKMEPFLLTELVLLFAAAAASEAEGKLNPTVGGLSQGKYPVRRGPSGVDWRTP